MNFECLNFQMISNVWWLLKICDIREKVIKNIKRLTIAMLTHNRLKTFAPFSLICPSWQPPTNMCWITCTKGCHFAFKLVSHTLCEVYYYHIGHPSFKHRGLIVWVVWYNTLIENLSTPTTLKIKSVSRMSLFWWHIEKL